MNKAHRFAEYLHNILLSRGGQEETERENGDIGPTTLMKEVKKEIKNNINPKKGEYSI